MRCGSGGSKSRLAKAAGAEQSGQMRDEKLHAVVARSTFRSENVQKHLSFWKLRWRKSARRCSAKHISKSKCTKHTILISKPKCTKLTTPRPLLEVQMLKKCTPLWREAHAPCQQQAKREGFVAFQKRWQAWDICRGSQIAKMHFAWQAQYKMFIRDVRRLGRWFFERGSFWSIKSVGLMEMIWRDRCSTSYDLAFFFVAGAIL